MSTEPHPGTETVTAAARRLYDAETALHAARQTGVDTWIGAAYDQLHAARLGYDAAPGYPGAGPGIPDAA